MDTENRGDLSTMTQEKWNRLTSRERDDLRDLSGLSKQLIGLEGARVEVDTVYGDGSRAARRFYVGRSTGWRPCHLEVARVDSHGGLCAARQYEAVRVVRPADSNGNKVGSY